MHQASRKDVKPAAELNVIWDGGAAMSNSLCQDTWVIPHHREQYPEDFANTLDVILWQIDKTVFPSSFKNFQTFPVVTAP